MKVILFVICCMSVGAYSPGPRCIPAEEEVFQMQNRRLDAKLRCIITNDHPDLDLTVKWMKQGTGDKWTIIPEDDKYAMSVETLTYTREDKMATLIIRNVQAIDYATYACIANNTVGLPCASEIKLVELVPGLAIDDILPTVDAIGKEARMKCRVTNKEADDKVLWSKEGSSISTPFTISEEERILVPGDLGGSKYKVFKSVYGPRTTYMLIISNLNEEDGGRYHCIVRRQGVSHKKWPSKSVMLTVKVPPTIRQLDKTVYELDEGGSLTLTCDAYGIPSPDFTWKRGNGKPLPSGSLLRLTNVKADDRGYYTCVADNQVKPSASVSAEIHVKFAPTCQAVEDHVGQAQNRRLSTKMSCIVAGFPDPIITWMKKGHGGQWREITDNDKYDISVSTSINLKFDEKVTSVTIKNVQANDYAQYKCVAKNRLGECSSEIQVSEARECPAMNCLEMVS